MTCAVDFAFSITIEHCKHVHIEMKRRMWARASAYSIDSLKHLSFFCFCTSMRTDVVQNVNHRHIRNGNAVEMVFFSVFGRWRLSNERHDWTARAAASSYRQMQNGNSFFLMRVWAFMRERAIAHSKFDEMFFAQQKQLCSEIIIQDRDCVRVSSSRRDDRVTKCCHVAEVMRNLTCSFEMNENSCDLTKIHSKSLRNCVNE